MSYCPTCGAANAGDARFCEKCGAQLSAGSETAPAVSKTPAPVGVKNGRPGAWISPLLITLIVVALLAGGVAFVLFRPMSEADYEDLADDLVSDIYNAQSDIDSSLYVMYFSVDALENDPDVPTTDDRLDGDDVDDARQEFDESLVEAQEAAEKLADVNPPKRYEQEHEDLLAWSDFILERLDEYEGLLMDAEDGMTYLDFSYGYDDLSTDDGAREWDGYWDAAEELGID